MKIESILGLEVATIGELAEIVKRNTDASLSEKEFEQFIASRRPLELLLMAKVFESGEINESNKS